MAGLTDHLAGAIVLASVVAVDPGGWYPFGPTKWLAVSTLTAAAVTAAAVAGVRPRLPRWAWVTGTALLAWLALAAAVGRDPLFAWIGTPERRLGVVAWLMFGACFAIGSTLDAAGVRTWTRWCVAAALWCGGYSLIEWWFGAPIETTSNTDRLGGPFGSAAYLGAALCLLVPIAGGVAIDRHERIGWRVAAGVAASTGVLALIGTGSRAAWLGLLVAAIVAAVAMRPPARVVIAGLACVAASLVVMTPLLDDVLDRSAPTESRIDEWAMGGRVVADHPILGLGPEGYRTSLADGVTAGYERTYGRDVLPDRAHSAPLDLAAAGGVPAALLYGALIGGVAYCSVRALMRRSPLAAVGVGVLAYLVAQLFLFPIAEIDPILWLAAGMLVAVAPERSARPVSRPIRLVTIGAAGVATVALFVTGVVGVAADRAAGDLTLAGARRAVELRPDVVRYHLLVAALATREGTLAGIDEAISAGDRALDVSPHDPIALRAAAQARTDRAIATGTAADVAAAVDAWQQMVEEDPLCRECQYGLGTAAALAGDAALAQRAWERADALSQPGDRRAATALDRLSKAGSP